jgi:protein-arginine kinase activator protein McsA
MTEQEMNQLADIIVDKIYARQEEFDKQFIDNMQETLGDDAEVSGQYIISEQELLEIEIKRLDELLSRYEQDEDYSKAAILNNKINKVVKKLNDLKK